MYVNQKYEPVGSLTFFLLQKQKKSRKAPPKSSPKKVSPKAKPKRAAPPKKKRKDETSEEEEEEADDGSEDDEPLKKPPKKAGKEVDGSPTDEDIEKLLKDILAEANLEEITMKTVCKKVYAHYPNHDLSLKKDFIKQTVKSVSEGTVCDNESKHDIQFDFVFWLDVVWQQTFTYKNFLHFQLIAA